MWNDLTGIVCGVDEALLAELHVLCLVIARKCNIISSNIERHAVTNIPLYSCTVTNASLDVGRQAGHARMITCIPHAH